MKAKIAILDPTQSGAAYHSVDLQNMAVLQVTRAILHEIVIINL
jgi:hypothetical protein